MSEKKVTCLGDDLQLMSEFDYEKNIDIDPTKFTSGSHMKLWWKCALGHSWSAAVSKRFMGQNCPYCSGTKAWKGYNDLSTTNPELVSEWDFEKNETPIYEYRPMSNKKVWWRCEKGHSWAAAVAKRVGGEKCPICQGKQVLAGFNDLATTHPELLQEWDYGKNQDVSPLEISKGSMAKVWWRCSRNHTWKAAVYSRVSGVGCPHCAKEIQSSFPEKAVYFYIKRMFPDAIANFRSDHLRSFELDVFIPSLQIGIEYDGERWHQDVEKDLQKNRLCADLGISIIRIREPSCPILVDGLSICLVRESKKVGLDKVIKGLLTEICRIANTECAIDVDVSRDSAAIMELLNPVEKWNSFDIENPLLASEWDYQKNGTLLPSMVTSGSDKKVWWICAQGHSYTATVAARIQGRGCGVCAGKTVLKGFNDFESRYPELAKAWDYQKNEITPDMVAFGSDKKFWWCCEKGHSYDCSINNRRAGQACPYCSGKRILVGFNDVATTHPDLAREWCAELNDLRASEVTAGSHKKIWWECRACGNRWITAVYNRCGNASGCPQCSAAARRKRDA